MEEEDEEKLEDLQEVKTRLADLLLVLLASPKHGVLFQDPEFGCEKSSNPLVTEVSSCYIPFNILCTYVELK